MVKSMKAKYRPAKVRHWVVVFHADCRPWLAVLRSRPNAFPIHPKLSSLHFTCQPRPTERILFLLASDATIRIGNNPSDAHLTDLMTVGQVAHVHYTIQNGTWLAHEIVVNPPHVGHAAKKSTKSEADELHTHGEILGYNAFQPDSWT